MTKQHDGLSHISDILPGLGLIPPEPTEPEQKKSPQKRAPRAVDIINSELIRPEDIAYTHSLFLQCFMPIRHNAKNLQRWETGNRNAKLVIRAGELVKPNSPGTFKQCSVPAGPKARLILAYINDYAYRQKTPVIPLGKNLHQAMSRMDVAVSGQNAKELQRELENLAAAEMLLGVWTADGSAHQEQTKLAKRMSFWIDKDPKQGTLWQPEMILSQDYYDSLQGSHMAPLHWPAYVALQSKPRAMDVFAFLQYRLRKPMKAPVVLHASVLHSMFGRDIKHLYHFWPRFLEALGDALRLYPTARVEVLNDGLKLWNSPALIAHRKMGRFGV